MLLPDNCARLVQDQYMVWTMRRLACHASRVVAVVGAGHLQVRWHPLSFPLRVIP